MEKCPKGVENEGRINALEDNMTELKKDVKEIKDRLLGRPTWIITVIITILTAVTCSSLTFAFTVIRAKVGM